MREGAFEHDPPRLAMFNDIWITCRFIKHSLFIAVIDCACNRGFTQLGRTVFGSYMLVN